jgi:hypothetical protein
MDVMSTHPAGWYPDPQGRSDHRYFDGTEWTDQVSRGGVVETDPLYAEPATKPARPAPVASSQLPPAMVGAAAPTAGTGAGASAQAALQRVSDKVAAVKVPKRAGFIALASGCAAVAFGSLMPWVKVNSPFGAVPISDGPRSGAAAIFIVLAGIALAVGWPLLRDSLSRGRAIGLAVVVALLGLFALTNWKDLADLRGGGATGSTAIDVVPGAGLLLYSAGVAALVVVTVWAFLRGPSRASAD